MRKITGLLCLFVLLSAFTCENEPLEGDFATGTDLSCEEALLNTVDAALAFAIASESDYTQLCNEYKAALLAQIDACGDEDGTTQAAIDALGDCSNDVGDDEDILGTWKLTAWIGEEPIDLNNDGTESINFLDEMDCYTNETIVFSADNTAVTMSTSYATFIYDIEVGTTDEYDYTIECTLENENTDVTWTQNGNIISVTDNGVTTDGTLNGDQLSIFAPEGFVAFISDFTATTTQDLTFVYTKQ